MSRSWVQLHRSPIRVRRRLPRRPSLKQKAHFDGLGANGEGDEEAAAGWGHLDGEELVVKGTGGAGGGKRVQIARARLKQWTPRVEDRFLATLAATCNVKAACAEVGMTAASLMATASAGRPSPCAGTRRSRMGRRGLEFALLEYAMNPFSSLDPAAPAPIPPMRADQALQNLHMHQRRLHGIGGTPGPPAQAAADRKGARQVLRNIEVLERGAASGGEKERDRRDYARRRRPG